MREKRYFSILIIFLILVIVAANLIQISIDNYNQSTLGETRQNISEIGLKNLLEFLGGIRVGIADYLWIKADNYFHLAPSKDTILTFLPLIRIITLLNPHFVMVYFVGGWHLMVLGQEYNRPDLYKEAEKFFLEGISNNPQSSDLYSSLGLLYFNYLHQNNLAIEYTEKAVYYENDFFKKHAELLVLGALYGKTKQFEKQRLATKEIEEIETSSGFKNYKPTSPETEASEHREHEELQSLVGKLGITW